MLSKHDFLNGTQPALVPVHGLQDKKPRFLDRDSIVIGRARGCDIGLDAPDISNLHCVISRTPEGFRIRDCGSRTGTKVNGSPVKSAPLQDGDILQLGLFSFSVQAPQAQPGHSLNSAKVEHLQKSRRHLARQALRLRRRLANQCEVGLSRTPTELTARADELKSRIHTYDERFAELEQAELELVRERDKLLEEQEAHRGHVQQVEKDLGRRLTDADAEIHKRWQEFQQRCQKEESHHAAHVGRPANQEAHLQDELREEKEELERFARELEEEQKRLDSTQKELDEERTMLRKQRQELSTMQEQLLCEKAPGVGNQDNFHSGLSRVEEGLSEQRQSLARMLADMEKLQQALLNRPSAVAPPPPAPSVDHDRLLALEAENAELRGHLEEMEKLLASTHADNKDLNELCGDHDLLRELLKDEQNAPPNHAALDKLRAENQCLTQLLQAKEEEITKLRSEATPVTKGTLRESDLENYEAELNQYRRQLDEERAKLNIEVEQMRQRNAEMDESVRDMEMDMSRERAELARERMRLDRLREDTRLEMERLQRDGPVRESLVGVQKLREEMNKGKVPTPGGPLNDRLKNLRSKLTD